MTRERRTGMPVLFFVTAASPPAGSRKEECDAWPLVDGNAGLVYLVLENGW